MLTVPGSEPADTLMLGVGIVVLLVTETGVVSPQFASSKLIRTWNWYSVAAVKPVRAICVSSWRLVPRSPESPTSVHGTPPVAVVKSLPDAVFLYRYCHL